MSKKRLFISFAVEDRTSRDFFVGQRDNDASPFDFVDMSVKEAWKTDWREQCNSKIKGCDGLIVLLSSMSAQASGVEWEIKCAKEAGIPILGIVIRKDDWPFSLPSEMQGQTVIYWTWAEIHAFINGL